MTCTEIVKNLNNTRHDLIEIDRLVDAKRFDEAFLIKKSVNEKMKNLEAVLRFQWSSPDEVSFQEYDLTWFTDSIEIHNPELFKLSPDGKMIAKLDHKSCSVCDINTSQELVRYELPVSAGPDSHILKVKFLSQKRLEVIFKALNLYGYNIFDLDHQSVSGDEYWAYPRVCLDVGDDLIYVRKKNRIRCGERKIALLMDSVNDMTLSPSGKFLYVEGNSSSGHNDYFAVISSETLEGHNYPKKIKALHPQKDLVAIWQGNRIDICPLSLAPMFSQGKKIELSNPATRISKLVFDHDGSNLLAVDQNERNLIHVINMETGCETNIIFIDDMEGPIKWLEATADNKIVVGFGDKMRTIVTYGRPRKLKA